MKIKFDFSPFGRSVACIMRVNTTSLYDRRRFLTRTVLALGAVGVAGAAMDGATAVALPEWLHPVAGHCVWSRGPDRGASEAWHIGVKDAGATMTALMQGLPAGTKVMATGQSLRFSGAALRAELVLHIV